MNAPVRPELISVKLCPFVHRTMIMLREKGVEHDTVYIDLADKPDWFLRISPFGKVPVLRIGDEVLFESAIINEYLDEVYPPPLHPADPLQRAHDRAWIEYGSELLVLRYSAFNAMDQAEFERRYAALQQGLDRVEAQLRRGVSLDGGRFTLLDAAYAPLLIRLAVADETFGLGLLENRARLQVWYRRLADYPAVRDAMPPGFTDELKRALLERDSFLNARR